MNVFEMLSAGFVLIFTAKTILLIIAGVLLGIVFGAIPGLSATMAVALCLPISFGMQPVEGISLLIGLYVGGISGGLISAILLKIPGTPASVATTFDGHPMAMQGQAYKAINVAILYSFLGTLIGVAALISIAPPLAGLALKFGAYEYFAVCIFSLTLISSLVSGSVIKGLASAVIGLIFSMVGAAPIDAYPRFTFGSNALRGGFQILTLLIGMFAVAEIISVSFDGLDSESGTIFKYKVEKGFGLSWAEFIGQIGNMIRSAAIGLGIGILPGIGGGTSNLLSYIAAKKSSKDPDKFGKGCIDGIIASECANNAGIGGALITLLSLGIPGDTTTAMLLGGLIIHGLTPGPLLFQKNGGLVYGIFIALLIASFVMLVAEHAGMKIFIKLLDIPRHILLPIIMSLCVVGAFGNNNRVFDIACIVFFGIVSFILTRFRFQLTPMMLGFILGGNMEQYLRRGLMQSEGSWKPFFTRPISLVFLILTFVSLAAAVWKGVRGLKKVKTAD